MKPTLLKLISVNKISPSSQTSLPAIPSELLGDWMQELSEQELNQRIDARLRPRPPAKP